MSPESTLPELAAAADFPASAGIRSAGNVDTSGGHRSAESASGVHIRGNTPTSGDCFVFGIDASRPRPAYGKAKACVRIAVPIGAETDQ